MSFSIASGATARHLLVLFASGVVRRYAVLTSASSTIPSYLGRSVEVMQ